jgi:hypothetical protein
VKNVDRVPANLDDVVGRKAVSPHNFVVIAADRANWCEGSERIQDSWIADVAAMNDEVRVSERVECLGSNQTMGIGDKANAIKRFQRVVTSC